jgi:hypothetical protein
MPISTPTPTQSYQGHDRDFALAGASGFCRVAFLHYAWQTIVVQSRAEMQSIDAQIVEAFARNRFASTCGCGATLFR